MKQLFKKYSTGLGILLMFIALAGPLIFPIVTTSGPVRYGECAIVTGGFYEGFVGYAWEGDTMSLKLTVIKKLPKGDLIKERITVSTGRAKVCSEDQEAFLKELYRKWDNQ